MVLGVSGIVTGCLLLVDSAGTPPLIVNLGGWLIICLAPATAGSCSHGLAGSCWKEDFLIADASPGFLEVDSCEQRCNYGVGIPGHRIGIEASCIMSHTPFQLLLVSL